MKRYEAIAPLSRDHHDSLILARLLKKNAPLYKGLPSDSKEKAKYAIQQFQMHIKKHFQQEEMILEKIKISQPEINILAGEIRDEHRQLTELFNTLSTSSNLISAMNTLANTLEDHIRKEERQLFPLLQEYCSKEELQEIYDLLH